jgi:Putative peptidoglycan binding domain
MRIVGVILVLMGLVLCFTIIGIFFGIPMILTGIVLIALGGRRKTIIQNVVTVSNAPYVRQPQDSSLDPAPRAHPQSPSSEAPDVSEQILSPDQRLKEKVVTNAPASLRAPPPTPPPPAQPAPPPPAAGVVGDPLGVRGRGSGLAWNRFVPIGLLVMALLLAVAAGIAKISWGKGISTGASSAPSVPSFVSPPPVVNAPSVASPPPVAKAPSVASPPPVTNALSGRERLPSQIPVGVTEQVGPSFDCRAAKQPLAQTLCADADLSRVDLRFAQAYWALFSQVGDSGSRDLKQEDLRFLDAVQQQCGIPRSGPVVAQTEVTRNCVKNAYEAQRTVWILRLTPPFSQEANRRIERHIALQRALQQFGFLPADAVIDGVYGPGTREAISQWQQSQNLKATGVLSDTDAAALDQQASTYSRVASNTEPGALGRTPSTASEAVQTPVSLNAAKMMSQTSLALVPLKYCGEYVSDGDPKGCYDAARGAQYTRKWYIRPGTTAALPWFPERNARIVYMRSFGTITYFLKAAVIE